MSFLLDFAPAVVIFAYVLWWDARALTNALRLLDRETKTLERVIRAVEAKGLREDAPTLPLPAPPPTPYPPVSTVPLRLPWYQRALLWLRMPTAVVLRRRRDEKR